VLVAQHRLPEAVVVATEALDAAVATGHGRETWVSRKLLESLVR